MSQSGQIAIALALGVTALLALALADRGRRREHGGARMLALAMLGVAIWSLGYAAEFLLPSLTGKLVAARVQYTGIVAIPVLWSLFVLHHSARSSWINRRAVASLAVIPGITLLLAWGSSRTGLLWSSTTLDSDASASGLLIEYGPWFWVHTAYSYTLLVASNALLVLMLARSLSLYRRQAGLLLVGLAVPLIVNVAYLLRVGDVRIDPTPFGLTVTGLLLAWGLWRWRLLDIMPVARARSIEGMRDGVIVLDHLDRVVDFNTAAAELLDFDEDQVVGRSLDAAIPSLGPAHEPDGTPAPRQKRIVLSGEGPGLALDVSISPIDGERGSDARHWLVVVRDVTEQHRAEDRLRAAEQRYRALVERIPAITYVREFVDRLAPSYMSPQVTALLGYTPEEVCSCGSRGWEQLIHADDRGRVLAAHLRAMQGSSPFAAEYRLHTSAGQTIWVRDEAVVISAGQDQPPHWQGVIVDISAQKQLESQLERHAFYDPLTGLANRSLLLDRLHHELARVQRDGSRVGVLFLDLDGFKIINDTLGHGAGDQVLQEVARRLEACLRAGDTAARLGGDEFVVLVEGVDDLETIKRIAGRIISAVRAPIQLADQEVVVTCSIGIRASEPGDVAPSDLLRDSDIAMYWAKTQGRARSTVFDPAMRTNRWERLELEADLRSAVQRKQLEIHYQPIVSLRTGQLSGFEALLRWNHPRRGLILPDEFIPVAEDAGLMVAIDRWVIATACRQVVRWQKALAAIAPELSLSVNVTPRHVQQGSIVADIEQALDASGMVPELLTLEITESNAMRDGVTAGERLSTLKQLGIKLVIDDFGTGYSALAYLRRFPIDGIKIDRSFVTGLGEREDDTALVEAVIAIARTFNLDVTAEGIETRAQWWDLRSLGADYGQGFFFARPTPAQALDLHIQAGDLSAIVDYPDMPRLTIVSSEG